MTLQKADIVICWIVIIPTNRLHMSQSKKWLYRMCRKTFIALVQQKCLIDCRLSMEKKANGHEKRLYIRPKKSNKNKICWMFLYRCQESLVIMMIRTCRWIFGQFGQVSLYWLLYYCLIGLYRSVMQECVRDLLLCGILLSITYYSMVCCI